MDDRMMREPSRLGVLRQACVECKACPLHKGAVDPVTPVFGWTAGRAGGPADIQAGIDPAAIRLVIVGEAPGSVENRVGRPFVGKAGEVLQALMREASIDLGTTWITNSVACFPHGKGERGAVTLTPTPEQVQRCAGLHLDPQLAALPLARVVVALGTTAAAAMLRRREGEALTFPSRLNTLLAYRPGEHGDARVHESGERRVLVTYHPSYLARQGYKGDRTSHGHEEAEAVVKALVAARVLAHSRVTMGGGL